MTIDKVTLDGRLTVVAGPNLPPGEGLRTERLQILPWDTDQPYADVDVHRHHGSDEVYVVIDGAVELLVDGVTIVVSAGEAVVVPAGVPYALTGVHPPARGMTIWGPAIDDREVVLDAAGETGPVQQPDAPERTTMISGIDHVQLAMPRGGEDAARSFYGELLGMSEVVKPAVLAARGGCWFRSGSAVLHLGVEEPFAPARKAHPALLVDDLDALHDRVSAAGYGCVRADGDIPGVRRFHTFDVFGNRIEFQQG